MKRIALILTFDDGGTEHDLQARGDSRIVYFGSVSDPESKGITIVGEVQVLGDPDSATRDRVFHGNLRFVAAKITIGESENGDLSLRAAAGVSTTGVSLGARLSDDLTVREVLSPGVTADDLDPGGPIFGPFEF